MRKKLNIAFVLPFIDNCGGVAVVLEYCRGLQKLGYTVEVYYPLIPYKELSNIKGLSSTLWQIKVFIKNIIRYKTQINWFTSPFKVKPVILIRKLFLSKCDILVATAWPTSYDVARINSNSNMIKAYFIQGYETWYGFVDKIKESYSLPLNLITISPWLTKKVESISKRNVSLEIHNGVDLKFFKPPAAKRYDPPSILLMYQDLDVKGCAEALQALSKIKASFPHVVITLFGFCDPPKSTFSFNYYKNPPKKTVLKLYQDANIFLFPSRGEGWGLTAPEAMACQCALVATNVGCMEIIGNGKNVVHAEINSAESIYRSLEILVTNKEKRVLYSKEAYRSIQNFSWELSIKKFDAYLQNLTDHH
ncbi:glycosyltransferase family 4 protein [Chitinispirillales bacterium ANBcel5]|uniref:glycosyltransferase family 4 protein n=1 Tax=Cellulosispirillum alkaliphilum TaxID=3039283 RepID=UPI002A587232|nr:glycosyltransferase family 4 protein [Chitinispirillales bacterium ANBcel5]